MPGTRGRGNGGTWHPDSECEIVLRHEDVDRRSQGILARYRIPADRSPDLMALKSSPTVDPPAARTAEVTIEHAGLTPLVWQAEERRDKLIARAAELLAPLAVDGTDIRRLVDECIRRKHAR